MLGPGDLVLAIDDEPDFRLLVSEMLSDAGYRVATAADGRAALASVANEMPALILLDIRMRGMDGEAFLQQFRRQYGAQTPVVLLSADTDSACAVDLAGRGQVLPKPFDMDDLLAAVGSLLLLSHG
jgi:DNA-binding response OmpR family regulator